jgi:hypothetical protein
VKIGFSPTESLRSTGGDWDFSLNFLPSFFFRTATRAEGLVPNGLWP